jgi:hypothetical protein
MIRWRAVPARSHHCGGIKQTAVAEWNLPVKIVPLDVVACHLGVAANRPIGSENPVGSGSRISFGCTQVRLLNPTPRVEITAPASVEIVVTDDAFNRTLRIHLLGYNSPLQTTPPKDRPFVLPMPIEDVPMYRVVIESHHPLKRAEAGNKSTVLKRRGQRVEATVNDLHEVVVLRY